MCIDVFVGMCSGGCVHVTQIFNCTDSQLQSHSVTVRTDGGNRTASCCCPSVLRPAPKNN